MGKGRLLEGENEMKSEIKNELIEYEDKLYLALTTSKLEDDCTFAPPAFFGDGGRVYSKDYDLRCFTVEVADENDAEQMFKKWLEYRNTDFSLREKWETFRPQDFYKPECPFYEPESFLYDKPEEYHEKQKAITQTLVMLGDKVYLPLLPFPIKNADELFFKPAKNTKEYIRLERENGCLVCYAKRITDISEVRPVKQYYFKQKMSFTQERI